MARFVQFFRRDKGAILDGCTAWEVPKDQTVLPSRIEDFEIIKPETYKAQFCSRCPAASQIKFPKTSGLRLAVGPTLSR